MALIVPQLAISYGATVIEKHVTHNRSVKGEDFESALNPDELDKLVSYLRQAEKAIGYSNIQDFYESMKAYRNVSRKRIVAASEIKAGDLVNKEQLTFKRSDSGMTPDELRYILGRKSNRKISIDEAITTEVLL